MGSTLIKQGSDNHDKQIGKTSRLARLSAHARRLPRLAPRPAQDDLRIGFIAPMTGIFAQVGADMVNGFQMYLDEHNGNLGGADVKLIVEDDQGKPDTAVTKAKKLILQDHVDMLIGGVLASTGYALAPVSTARKDRSISPRSPSPTT